MIKPRLKSLLLVILKETHIIVTVATAISILYLRSVHSLWFGVGTLVATGTVKVLKKCIRQPRPVESSKQTYGMPSTHSSSISFFAVYLFLSCLLLPVHTSIRRLLPGDDARWQDVHGEGGDGIVRLLRTTGGVAFVAAAGAVCWSRVKLGHHTPTQVVAGATVGASIGWLWFALWAGFRFPVPHSSRSIAVEGFGEQVEATVERATNLLSEAWQMRDGGLIWDGLIRPTLNDMSSFIGLGTPFHNGLPPGTNLAPVHPHLIQ